jgi:bacteriorhodopsin
MGSLLNQTINYSLGAQILTLLTNFFGLSKQLDPKHTLLTDILGLETIVQIVELIFYIWYKNFMSIRGSYDVTKFRYYDWAITTPIMLFSTIAYYIYLKTLEKNTGRITLTEIFETHKLRIILILFLNFLMLLFGYLQEIGVISIYASSIFGYIALCGSFYGMYDGFVRDVSDKRIFNFMFIVWSLYGIAAMLPNISKNIGYNILDVFAKNFYGLYLTFLITRL